MHMTTTSLMGGAALALPLAQAAVPLFSDYHFNPLEHLGGVAPYFEPLDPEIDPSAPQGCKPVRAAYLVRHAAIYANDFDYEEFMEPFISKFQNISSIDWSRIPDLSFLNRWVPPISEAESEMLTRVGKLEATELGASMSFRYPGLKLPKKIWTSSAERTYESAKALIRGFEPAGQDDTISLVSVYESKEGGADNLTPYKACPKYSSSAGSEQQSVYLKKFTKPIMARLNAAAPEFNFTSEDVYGMMQLCGYESVIRGSSPFCDLDLFSPDDWLAWEYTADLQYHYNTGYGSDVSGAIGLPWVNTTAGLLMSEPGSEDVQDLYVSFTHRELPPTVLVAMGLFNNSAFGGSEATINDTMPSDRINHRRAWKSSHVIPFMTNVAMERLNCTGSYGYDDGDYYRVLVNNAPQPLPDCGDGPGTTCSRSTFETWLQDRADKFSGFSEKCGTASSYDNSTDAVTFYSDKSENGTFVGKRNLYDQE